MFIRSYTKYTVEEIISTHLLASALASISLAISKVHVINPGQWSLSGSDVSPWDWGPARAILKAPGTGWNNFEMEEVSWSAWVLCEKDTSLYCGSLQNSRFSVEVPCDIYGYTLDILFREFLPFSFYLLNSIARTYPSFLKVESYPMTISWLISPFPYPWDFRLLVIFALVWFCLHKQCCHKYLYTDNFTYRHFYFFVVLFSQNEMHGSKDLCVYLSRDF